MPNGNNNPNIPSMGMEKELLWKYIQQYLSQRGLLTEEELRNQATTTFRPIEEKYGEAEEMMEGRMLSRGMFNAPFTLEEFQKLDKEKATSFQDLMTNLTTSNLQMGQQNQLAGFGALSDLFGMEYKTEAQRGMMREQLNANKKKWWEDAIKGLFTGAGMAGGFLLGGPPGAAAGGAAAGGLFGGGGGGTTQYYNPGWSLYP